MSSSSLGKIAILWRGDRAARETATPQNSRFHLIFEELGKLGIMAQPAVYDEEFHDEVGAQLRNVDGILVWVNPIQDGRDRLNELLRQVSSHGPWVSAHPDVIDTLGVKEVLFRTRAMGWGTDTELYASLADLSSRLLCQLAGGRARVLKQSRGNDGQGVWKVEAAWAAQGNETVQVCEAYGGSRPVEMLLSQFLKTCASYFEDGGVMIDQPFQPRLRDGMTRCYLSADRVAGFAHQHPPGLMDPADMHPDAALGKVMFGPDEPRFARLRAKMEAEWVSELMDCLGLAVRDLPVIWDADFLYGPRDEAGADTYVLCEINVSSVFAIPDQAAAALARTVARRLDEVG